MIGFVEVLNLVWVNVVVGLLGMFLFGSLAWHCLSRFTACNTRYRVYWGMLFWITAAIAVGFLCLFAFNLSCLKYFGPLCVSVLT